MRRLFRANDPDVVPSFNRQHEVKHTNALEELAEKIDEALNARAEHPHRRK
jgi:hypothetical protein